MAPKPELFTLRVTGDGSGPGYMIEVVELPGCIAMSKTLVGIRSAADVAIAIYFDSLIPEQPRHHGG